jgi:hypothetical protein
MRNTFLMLKATQSMVFCYSNLNGLRHTTTTNINNNSSNSINSCGYHLFHPY